MSTTVKFVSVPSKTLAASINASASAIQLSDIKGWDGVNLAAANFGDVLWAVLRNSTNTQMEIMKLDPTTIANSSITVLLRGLDFSGGFTEVTANKLTWIKNDTIVELGSNPPQLLNQGVMVTGNQTIADLKTFSTLPQCTAVPTVAADLANKAYVDSVVGGNANYDQNIVNATAGENLTAGNVAYLKASDGKWYVADSATATKSVGVQLGIVQGTVLSGAAARILIGGRDKTQTALTAGSVYYLGVTGAISTTKGANVRYIGQTPSGSTTDLVVNLSSGDPEILNVDGSRTYVADTGAANAYVCTLVPAITSLSLKAGFRMSFKAVNANTTTSTVNVNALGAKTIKKVDGATNLASGDIAAGMIVDLEYDGTNFVMLNPVGNAPVALATLKFGGDGSSGALAISSGTTTIDVGAASLYILQYSSLSITGTGSLAFSNPNAAGTTVVILVAGAATITSSATAAIDLRGMGAAGGAGGVANNNGTDGTTASPVADDNAHNGGGGTFSVLGTPGSAGAAGAAFGLVAQYTRSASQLVSRITRIAPGSGGGGGGASNNTGSSNTGGAGGRGGGALLMQVYGSLNFTGTIKLDGSNGTDAPGQVTANTNIACGGGGGAGAGGMAIILYNSQTAVSGTVTNGGGTGGAGGTAQLTATSAAGTSIAGGSGGGGGGADGAGGAGGTSPNTDSNGNGGGAGVTRRAGGGGGAGGSCSNGSGGNPHTRTGGAGGAGGASENVLVTQNYWFV